VKDTTISFDNFSFRYLFREQPAVVDFNLSIPKGEFLVITGASGSGKSTICYSLLGLLGNFYEGKKHGSLKIEDTEISDISSSNLSKTIGYIPQRIENSFATPYVFSEIAFSLEYQNYSKPEIVSKVHSVVKDLNIKRIFERKLNELSEGEKQLITIAAAIVNEPTIVIADEPLANLDQSNKKLILDTLRFLNEKGKTIIVATHEYEEYLQIASRIIRMDSGKIVEKDLQKKHLSTKVKKKKSFTKSNSEIKKPTKLSINNLNFNFSNKFELSNINLDINEGQVVALVGDNGSGKTTLLKLIVGLLKPKIGSIRIDDQELKTLSWVERTQRIGVVFQNPDIQFFEEKSIDEIILISNNLKKEVKSDEIEFKLENSGLKELLQYNPHSLSHGEKRRLTFLSAIQHKPDILILDEVTSGLDEKNKLWAKNQIENLKDEGTTIIVISHNLKWVEEVADEFIGLHKGQIKFQIPKNQFRAESYSKYFKDSANGGKL
jgi:energy-coupling factor transport system ATP-binding protein